MSDALEARLAAVDLSTASITSATSVKSTTSATSANGKEVSFSGLGEEAERLVSDIDAVLDGAATKQVGSIFRHLGGDMGEGRGDEWSE